MPLWSIRTIVAMIIVSKRVSNVSNESLGKRIVNNHKLMIYLFVFLIGMTIIGLSAFFIVKKNLKGGE